MNWEFWRHESIFSHGADEDLCARSRARFNINTVFPRYGIPMWKIRRPWDRLIFNMGIPILTSLFWNSSQISRAETSNYTPQYLRGIITYPCLLAPSIFFITVPGHYLNRCWLITIAMWHSYESNFTRTVYTSSVFREYTKLFSHIICLKQIASLPSRQIADFKGAAYQCVSKIQLCGQNNIDSTHYYRGVESTITTQTMTEVIVVNYHPF